MLIKLIYNILTLNRGLKNGIININHNDFNFGLSFYRIYNSSYRGPFLNSLWSEKEWKNKTVMVIIPHQDDEINLAGATIKI